jgi:hypothetical protein
MSLSAGQASFSRERRRRREAQRGSSLFFDLIVYVLLLTPPLALTASVALAQAYSAVIVGVVRDERGERLAGVKISLSKTDLVIAETTADKDGHFEFLSLVPGLYTLDIALSGWQSKRLTKVEARAYGTIEIDVALSQTDAVSGRKAPSRGLDREVRWGRLFGQSTFQKLPSTRSVWSILESQEPSTVTDVLDIGGLKVGRPALSSAHGASWTETEYLFDGFNVTDPYAPGRPLFYPEFDDIATLEVTTASKPAPLAGSGITLEIETSQPPEGFHGTAQLYYSNHQVQSDNVDERLRRFHFAGPERLEHLADGALQIGGRLPLERLPWPFFGSFATQNLTKSLGGFAAPIDARVYSALAKFTPWWRGPNRLDMLFASQHVYNSPEGADPRIEPIATTRGKNDFYQFQTHWRGAVSTSSALTLGLGVVDAIVSSGIQPGAEAISTLDLPEMTRTGSAELSTAGNRTRWELSALFQTVHEGYVGGHSLNLGFDWDRSYITNRWDARGGIGQVLVEGVGAQVTRWNTPTETRSYVQNIAAFVQDAWSPLKWLRLPVGLRFETSSGKANGADNKIKWTTIEPRVGFVVPLVGEKLVLRASWSRYGHLVQGRYLDFGNPNAIGGEVFRWDDANSDRQAQPQELVQLIRMFGGPHSVVDRNLSRPFTDEISFGLEHHMGRRLLANARFFRRDTHRIIRLANVGVPLSSYDPVSVIDPGNDGIVGTNDDKPLTLYNEKQTALGKDFLLLTNAPDGRGSYKGFELGLSVVVGRGEFSASFAAMKTHAPTNPGNSVFENDSGLIGSLGTDPNTFLFANGRTFFDRAYIGKMTGYYNAPLGLRLGAVAKYYDGLPFGRLLFVEGFNQGPLFVRTTPRAQPGGFRTQFNMTLDVRVGRQFALPRGNLSAYLDVFNLLNLNQNTVEASLTSPSFEMRVPLAIQSPRVAGLGLQWRF